MKLKFLKPLVIAFITVFTVSCSKDENNSSSTQNTITKATIVLKKTNGEVVTGISVYAYEQQTWQIMGDDPAFADGQAASDATGSAIFSNIEYPTTFTSLNNNQNNFRFSAHYSLNGVNKTKVTATTFNKGQQKIETVILD